MRLRTSDAPDGEGGNKWQRTGINDGAADANCPGSRSGPKCPHPRAGLVAIFELQGRQFWKRRPSLPTTPNDLRNSLLRRDDTLLA
jgi:hypothetical protein